MGPSTCSSFRGSSRTSTTAGPAPITRIGGHEDADAYQFYINSGNEIVILDDAVIKKGKELSYAWADKVAAEQGGWFKKVLAHQRAYQKSWANAYKYRDTPKPK